MSAPLGKVAFGLLVGLVTGELVARAVLGNQATSELYVVEPGDGRCLGLKPNTTVTYTGWGLRIPGVIQEVNGLGYRGPEYPKERKPGTLRVAVLGDSFVYGMGETVDQSFPAWLERSLQETVKREVEVLNFGIPGTNTQEHVDQYRYFAREWKADVVLLAVSPNDLELDSSQGAALCETVSDELARPLRHLYLHRLIWTAAFAAGGAVEGDPEKVLAWFAVELQELNGLVTPDRARLGVVFFDLPPVTDDADRFRREFTAGLPSASFIGEGWMDPEHPQGLPRIPKETHWTGEGNRLAAERTAAWMRQAGLL